MQLQACILLLATLLHAISPMVAAAQPVDYDSWIEKTEGEYRGELLTGNAFAPVVTTLRVQSAATIVGHYVFVEPSGKNVGGELTDCAPMPSRELGCRWHDEYGTGRLVLTFDANLKSFRGRWSSSQSPARWQPWSGRRE